MRLESILYPYLRGSHTIPPHNPHTQGGLPILGRLVLQGEASCRTQQQQQHGPSPTALAQLRLTLDVLEAAAYLNVDNQVFLGSHRVAVPTPGAAGKRRGGAGGGGGSAPVPLVHVLLDVLGHARAFAERHEQKRRQQQGKAGGEDDDDDSVAGAQPQALAKRRAPDLLLACLRVLVNCSHHNRGAVERLVEVRGRAPLGSFLCVRTYGTVPAVLTPVPLSIYTNATQHGGMEALLACFLAHTRGRFLLEAIGHGPPPPPTPATAPAPTSTKGKGQTKAAAARGSSQEDEEDGEKQPAAASPPAHGLRETESFDVKLLALNALTNCVERGEGARARVGELAVALAPVSDAAAFSCPLAIIPAAAAAAAAASAAATSPPACKGGKGKRGVTAAAAAAEAAGAATTPMVRFLAQYLLLRVRPFRDQLAKALIVEDEGGGGGGGQQQQQGQGGGEVVVIDDDSSAASEVEPAAAAARAGAGAGAGEEEGEEELFGDEQAEQLVLAGYTALLLGCLMRAHPGNRAEALSALPSRSPTLLVRVLKAFLAFQQQVRGVAWRCAAWCARDVGG